MFTNPGLVIPYPAAFFTGCFLPVIILITSVKTHSDDQKQQKNFEKSFGKEPQNPQQNNKDQIKFIGQRIGTEDKDP